MTYVIYCIKLIESIIKLQVKRNQSINKGFKADILCVI